METTVTVGTDRVWVEDSGGPGPAAVLLHPGIADARSWDLVWPALTERLRLIRYDARGYGRSPNPTEEFRHLDDLTAVLDQLAVPSAHLVGCSMGGANAIDLALASPERVRSITLLCPGVTGYKWPSEPELDAEAAAAQEAGEDAVVAMSLREWAAAGAEPLVVDMMRSAVRARQAEDAFVRDAEPAFDRLGDVRAPAVLMVGDRDRPALIECDEAVAARIPDCELIRMPGVDHLPAIREPGLVAQTILRQIERAGS
jgi:3-oxoadipate enol-lactonase